MLPCSSSSSSWSLSLKNPKKKLVNSSSSWSVDRFAVATRFSIIFSAVTTISSRSRFLFFCFCFNPSPPSFSFLSPFVNLSHSLSIYICGRHLPTRLAYSCSRAAQIGKFGVHVFCRRGNFFFFTVRHGLPHRRGERKEPRASRLPSE